MKKHTFDVPALFADHHVQEVRRILAGIPGVQDVYASSAFQVIEVEYDESLTNDLEIAMKLDEAGYLGEWTAPIEIGVFQAEKDSQPFFRHTEVQVTSRQVVSFAQNVSFSGRPLWTCPGIGVVNMAKILEEEE